MIPYKKDLKYSIISGLITGIIAWKLFNFLGIPVFFNISYAWLILVIPIFWFIGVNFGYFLGRIYKPFDQFGRFTAVGFTNAAVDFGILNLFFFLTGTSSGFLFSVFKTVSFLAAMINSYVFNKYWTFDAGKTHGGKTEFAEFAGVAVLAIIVNVGTASLVVGLIDPIGGLGANAWANVGAAVGAATALMFSFLGFRRVFKK